MTTVSFPSVTPVDAAGTIWGLHLKPAGCPNCMQTHLVEEARIGHICPNCISGKLEPQPALLRSELPELILPFQKVRRDLLPSLQAFTQGVWLHGDDFTPESLVSRAVPVYWPMWLVDGEICGDWFAEAGFDYQVKSSQEKYQSGRWQTYSTIETRVRWSPRAGEARRRYENIPVPAASDHQYLWRRVKGYSLDTAVGYEPGYIRTTDTLAVLRVPDLQPENAWPEAEAALKRAAAFDCQQAAGAQHVRSFAIHASYNGLHWTQLLLPMYVSYYKDDEGRPQLVYINGITGAAGGIRLASQRKGWLWAAILAGSGTAMFLFGLLMFSLAALFPPAGAAGAVQAFLGLVLIVLAVIPAVWPWQWNRRQQDSKVFARDSQPG